MTKYEKMVARTFLIIGFSLGFLFTICIFGPLILKIIGSIIAIYILICFLIEYIRDKKKK